MGRLAGSGQVSNPGRGTHAGQGWVRGQQGWDLATGFPRRRRDQRRRARRRRGLALPDRRRGGARRRRREPAAADAAAGLLPADVDGDHGRARPGHRHDLQDRRPARRQGRRPAQQQGRAGRARPGRPGLRRRGLRLRRRRRRRERARGGEVLPGPLRAGRADPPARPAARLRRALAPQRVPRAQRGRRRRRRDDPAQRRHGEPRQHRRLEPAGRLQARHPRLLRAARARHARLLRRRQATTSRAAPRPGSRPPTGCARCCCSRPRTGARTRWPRTASTRPSPTPPRAGRRS